MRATDTELLRRACRKEDDAAFQELLRRYERHVVACVCKFGATFQEAEEVAQEAFLQLFKLGSRVTFRFDKYDSVELPLTRAAIWRWLKRLRHADVEMQAILKYLLKHPNRPPQPDGEYEMQEKAARVRAALAELSPALREAAWLALIDGLEPWQIAERTQKHLRTVQTNLRRARNRLAELLAPYRKGETHDVQTASERRTGTSSE